MTTTITTVTHTPCQFIGGCYASAETMALGPMRQPRMRRSRPAPLRPDLPTEVEVVTTLRLGSDNHSGDIARSQDYLGYRPGELAVVLLDFDNKGRHASVRGSNPVRQPMSQARSAR
jgi:hypothetical protein